MIEMEDAVTAAIQNFQKLYKKSGVTDPLLEEIELSPDRRVWSVTIGFNSLETDHPSALEKAMAKAQMGSADVFVGRKKPVRRYKLFEIDAETGELRSMKRSDS